MRQPDGGKVPLAFEIIDEINSQGEAIITVPELLAPSGVPVEVGVNRSVEYPGKYRVYNVDRIFHEMEIYPQHPIIIFGVTSFNGIHGYEIDRVEEDQIQKTVLRMACAIFAAQWCLHGMLLGLSVSE